jgi:hypothetical protein
MKAIVSNDIAQAGRFRIPISKATAMQESGIFVEGVHSGCSMLVLHAAEFRLQPDAGSGPAVFPQPHFWLYTVPAAAGFIPPPP